MLIVKPSDTSEFFQTAGIDHLQPLAAAIDKEETSLDTILNTRTRYSQYVFTFSIRTIFFNVLHKPKVAIAALKHRNFHVTPERLPNFF